MSNDDCPKSGIAGPPQTGTTVSGTGDRVAAIRFDPDKVAAERARLAEARRWLQVKRCAALADIDMALTALERLRGARPGRNVDGMIEDLSVARREIDALDPNELPSADALAAISLRLKSRFEAFCDRVPAARPQATRFRPS